MGRALYGDINFKSKFLLPFEQRIWEGLVGNFKKVI